MLSNINNCEKSISCYVSICCVQLKELLQKLDESLKSKDGERKAYKEKHGIMTQEEREAVMKRQQAK